MKDQYNGNIPCDLTLLDCPVSELSPVEIKGIDNLEWYCFEGNQSNHIFVSQSKLEEILGGLIDNYPPEEFASDKIVKIDSVLHRWNESFYWA
jgi:hypothetical protein